MHLLLKRPLLMVVLPALLLFVIEGFLHVIGYGIPTSLYINKIWNNTEFAFDNPRFTRIYFGPEFERKPWPTAFPAQKSDREFRVFLLGESAGRGDPIPEYGMARIMEHLLQNALTNRRVRVINSAISAINSHVIRDIAREVIQYQPDAVVIYMGHNEIAGPFGPGAIFVSSFGNHFMTRASTWLRGTRTVQLIENTIYRFISARPSKRESMAMFLKKQIEPNDPRLNVVRATFADHLQEIIAAFHQHHVPVVLGTVAVNLRDCAPLSSPISAAISPRDRQEIESDLTLARHELIRGRPDHALSNSTHILAIDPALADGFYIKARALDALQQYSEAAAQYREALEHDALRFRADNAINTIIRQTADAASSNVAFTLVDCEQAIMDASPFGLPGESMFYDHVHLTFPGQYIIASNMAAAVLARHTSETIPLLSADETAQRVGWSMWGEAVAFSDMHARRLRPPFSQQIDHEEIEKRWSDRLTDLSMNCRTSCWQEADHRIGKALEYSPDDVELWTLSGEMMIEAKAFSNAAISFARASTLLPHQTNLYILEASARFAAGETNEAFSLLQTNPLFRSCTDDQLWAAMGIKLVEWKRSTESEQAMHRARLLNPDNSDVLVNLGIMRASAGQWGEAVKFLRTAAKKNSRDDLAWAYLGRALYESGSHKGGIRDLEIAAELDPENGTTFSSLAVMYRREGKINDARNCYNQAVKLLPLDANLLADAATFEQEQGRYDRALELFRRAARIQPTNHVVVEQYAFSMLNQKDYEGAASAFSAASRLNPSSARTWYGLAVCSSQTGHYEISAPAIKRAIVLEPDNILYNYAAGQILLQTEEKSNAVSLIRHSVDTNPNQRQWAFDFIWLLSTHPDASIRNPEEALYRINQIPPEPVYAWIIKDLKSAALAANGEPDQAVELLETMDWPNVPESFRELIRKRLELYRQGKTYVADLDEFRAL